MRGWLAEKRKASNMTQSQIAKKLGISEGYYSYIESGDRQKKMDLTLAAKLSAVLGISVDEIIKLENSAA